MNRARLGSALALAAGATLLAACGAGGKKLVTPTTTGNAAAQPATTGSPPVATVPNYHPRIDPANFTNRITNRYFPLAPGRTQRYNGKRDGIPTQHVMRVTRATKTVMGVRCLVISDIVTQNHSLVEKTTDWYAQDTSGSVWYFGEDTAEYQNGVVTSTQGTWEAGVDRAFPGIVMPAVPKVGRTYQQEYRPGVALDRATVLATNTTVRVPAGTFRHVVVTFDKNPLDPSKKERKYFAPGVGFVRAVLHGGGHTELTWLVR
jgi:hypothetical protein